MKIIAYPVTTEPHKLIKSSPKREWMDSSPSKYAYRCLPLNIANSYGWEIITEASFEVSWEGDNSPSGVSINYLSGKKSHVPIPLFGEGTFTFHTGYLFKTEYPQGLYVTGPVNFSKENVIPLSGIVETHWLPFTFTMNWKFSQPGKVIFNEGDSICHIFPVDMTIFDSMQAEIRTLSEDKEFEKLYFDWVNSRSQYIADKKQGKKVEAWQKNYMQGTCAGNEEIKCPFHKGEKSEEISTHKTKISPPDFIDKQTAPFSVPQKSQKNMNIDDNKSLLDNIVSLAKEVSHPTLFFIASGDCDPESLDLQKKFVEDKLQKIEENVSFFTTCISELDMGFPRIQTPALYYFIPNSTTYAFWRPLGYQHSIETDVKIAYKMMQGMTYEEARFSDEEKQKIKLVDDFLEKEQHEIKEMPPIFQQARNLAKEMWKSGKRAAQGLPVLVDAQTGFQRLSTCQSCEFFNQESSRCSQCGCFMKTKTQLASASCPVGKWNAVV